MKIDCKEKKTDLGRKGLMKERMILNYGNVGN